MNSIHILLSLAADLSWTLNQLEVKNVFLHGHLEEEIYMHVPLGFRSYSTHGKVCRWKSHCTSINKHLEPGLNGLVRPWESTNIDRLRVITPYLSSTHLRVRLLSLLYMLMTYRGRLVRVMYLYNNM